MSPGGNDPNIQSLVNYVCYVCYSWDLGLRGVPVCGPPGTPLQIVAEHPPICYKHVSWMAQAQDMLTGGPDVSQFCPDWNTQNSNEVLVAKAISSPFKADLGDGTLLSTIVGVYSYLLLVPPSNTDNLASSMPPWSGVAQSPYQQVVYPLQFMTGLLNSATTQPNPSGGYGGLPGTPQPTPLQKPPPQGLTDLGGFFIKPPPGVP